MKVKLKNILFWLMLLILMLGTVESICYLTFKHFKKRFTFFDSNQYLGDEINIKDAYQKYHPERGWDKVYPTKFGERPRSIEYNKPLISAFGDSYVYCYEVKHNETWEEYLSALLKNDVYNFGTCSYGTDQAYLKFLSLFPEVRTPVVILGLVAENINRIVNVYRPFYYENTLIKLTKPRFILKQDRLFLLPNPVRSSDEIRFLRNAYFLSQIGKNDFWFNRDRYPEYGFPYLKILFNKRIWLEIIYSRKPNMISDLRPRPYVNLWKDAGSTTLMFKIFESFIANSKDLNAVPIIMILPSKSEVIEKFKHRKSSIVEKKILDFCREHDVLVFNSIGALANRANSVSEIESFFNGHISSKGNQIIAEVLYDFLKENGLNTGK
jgi:hypothetical protein